MKILLSATTGALTLFAALSVAAPVLAQDTVSGTWTLGVAQLPDYEGSDETQTLPLLGFRLEYADRSLELQGTSLRADLLKDPAFEAGPVLTYRFGRDDVDNAAVAALPDIDDTIELGVFAAWSTPIAGGGLRLSAELLGDVGGVHDGLTGTLSAGYGRQLSDRLSLGAAFSMTAVDSAYATTYFGVDAAGAAASGLSAFAPGGGVKDAGLDLSLSYAVTDRTSLTGLVGYRRLLGDFADSPVTASKGQLTIGLGLSRSF